MLRREVPDGGEEVAFTLLECGDDDGRPHRFEANNSAPVVLGCDPESDIFLSIAGLSWHHTEFRGTVDRGTAKVLVRDTSKNGTGIRLPGTKDFHRLQKNTDTNLPDESLVVLPMKVHSSKNIQKTFLVRIERSKDVGEQQEGDGSSLPSELGKRRKIDATSKD